MLRYLRVRDLAVFKEAACELGPGLNLITGETGAGKSLLVDAIGLLVGDRASQDSIRTGEPSAVVEGIFDLSPPVRAVLQELGIDAEGEELLVRRSLQAAGRSRAFLNDSAVTLEALRRVGEVLVEIHGQHAHQALLRPDTHREWLDEAAGLREPLAEAARLFHELRRKEDELRNLEEGAAEREQRRDFLEFQIREIEEADPRPGETEQLRAEAAALRHREQILALSHAALQHAQEDEGSASRRAGQAGDALSKIAALVGDERTAACAAQIAEARVLLEDAARTLASFVDTLEADPARLDQIELRLAQLEKLERRHGGTLDAVLAFLEDAQRERDLLAASADHAGPLRDDVDRLRAEYLDAAGRLHEGRTGAAPRLSHQVERELEGLGMTGARFEIRIDPRSRRAAYGTDAVEFLVSPNPGEDPRPLRRIASGGELSRIMLALRTCLPGKTGGHETLVFDEVDAGVSGETAFAVGERLSEVASRAQVLCVTHLPQIAARAATHLAVAKRRSGGRTRVEVRHVQNEDRIEEVARMLGGTKAAGRHARQLLEATA